MNTHRAWRIEQRGKREDAAIRAMYWIMTALLVGALLMIVANVARAEEAPSPQSSPARGEDVNRWTAGDTALQVLFLTALAIDRGQTAAQWEYGLQEIGWAKNFIGSHPSSGQVNRYFATCAVLHTAVAYVIPKPYRTIWQSFWIGVEVSTIDSNVKAGISVRF